MKHPSRLLSDLERAVAAVRAEHPGVPIVILGEEPAPPADRAAPERPMCRPDAGRAPAVAVRAPRGRVGSSRSSPRATDVARHAVHLYSHDAALVEAVGAYLRDGLAAGEGAVIVAARPHWEGVRARLLEDGLDVSWLLCRGRLHVLESAATLDRLLVEGVLSPAAFARVVLPVLHAARGASPARRVRVYGEMVDDAWTRGRFDTAAALEATWNDALLDPSLRLLCGYRADVGATAVPNGAFAQLACAHGHVSIEPGPSRAAVARAIHEILSPTHAAMLCVVVDADHAGPHARGDVLERQVLWLRVHMPRTAEKVLGRARELQSTPALAEAQPATGSPA